MYVHPGASWKVDVMIDRVLMQGNARGVRAEDGSRVVISNSTATGSTNNGFVALATSRAVDMTITDSVSSLNGAVGVYSGTLATVKISGLTISGNNVGLQSAGGTIISFGNNSVQGNITEGTPTQAIGRI